MYPTRDDIIYSLITGTFTALLAAAIVILPGMVGQAPLDGAAYAQVEITD